MTPRTAADPDHESSVRSGRKSLRLTQAELGTLVGVSRHTVIAIEQGDYAPSVFLALRIARTLGATVEDLFGAHPEAATDPQGEAS